MAPSEPTAPPSRPHPPKLALEVYLEQALFASRWLLTPFYIGLAVALGVLAVSFIREFILEIPGLFAPHARPEAAILMALSLVDMSLAANLMLIVIFSGYENFVSKINTGNDEDRPSWMGKVDFSGLKIKLIASIVAISAISLLKSYMVLGDEPLDEKRLMWQVAIHLTFVVSGVLFALMDWLTTLGARNGEAH